MGWTRNLYDTAGRLVEIGHYSGNQQTTELSKTTYTYPNDIYYTVKDEAANSSSTDNPGSARTVKMDAAGRVSEVDETIGGQAEVTTYSYDGLDNLTDVWQGTQHRHFTYDALGRLTNASYPEIGNGSIAYGYDYNGNLITKTDTLGVITCFGQVSGTQCLAGAKWDANRGYDGLNRLFTKQYTDGTTPRVDYTYCPAQGCGITNGIGRLIKVASNGTTVSYDQFDADGRVLHHSQQNPAMNGGAALAFSYSYTAAGLNTITYPSGRAVTTTYDNAGRPGALAGVLAGTTTNYAGLPAPQTYIQYAPHGAVSQMYLNKPANGQWTIGEQRSYNPRLQPTSIITSGLVSGQTLLSLGLNYATSASTGAGVTDGAENNGNLLWQTISGTGLPAAVTQAYTYDGANRIQSMSEKVGTNASACSRGFSYDRWGNVWVSSSSDPCINAGPFTPTANVYNATTNCSAVNGGHCDAAGRQDVVGGYGYTYDAENRLVTSLLNKAVMYLYDGDGKRVAKINCPDTTACTFATANATTLWYVYDAQGNLAAEYGGNSAGNLPCTTCYLSQDHLGSTRMLTDQSGAAVACHDYLPFGEEWPSGSDGRTNCYPSAGGAGLLFTGKERDAETGLDWFNSRYFSSAQGRFTSPDKPFAGQNPANPQSWNLYSYSLNNPLRYIDPTGHDPEEADNDCGKNMKDCGPQITALPQTTSLGQTQDRAVGVAKGVGNMVLDLAQMMGAPQGNVDEIREFLHLDPASQNQRFGAELGGILGMLLPGGEAEKAGEVASSLKSGLKLKKALASEQQMSEILSGAGEIIAGPGARTALRDAPRLSVEYGGATGDWVKVASSNFKAADGTSFEIHAYKNVKTGKIVEFKTKFQ